MGFDNDKAFGCDAQTLFCKMMAFKDYKIMEDYFPDYDIAVYGEEPATYEIKCDRMAIKTGNLAIEFMYRDQPSGITHTKADYWVHFVSGTNRFYVVPVADLRKILAERTLRSVRGGDRYDSSLYLLPMIALDEYEYEYE